MNTPKILATFTLQSLQKFQACQDGYDTLVASLPVDFPLDQPINLLTALSSNPVRDIFWALRAVSQDISHLLGPLSADVAEAVLPNFERAYPNDDRPRKAIEAARAGNPDAADAAADAAYAAATTADADAAYAADAARAAARAAFYAADADAAFYAAAAANAAYAAYAADAADAAYAAYADRAGADFDQTLIKILKNYFSEE